MREFGMGRQEATLVHSLPAAPSTAPIQSVLGTPQVRTKLEASPQPFPHTRPHLHSQAEPSKQRDIWAGVTPTPALTCPHRRAMDTGRGWDGGSILTSLALVLIEKLPQLLLLLPHRQLRHRRVH